MFEIEGHHIAELNDEDLRTLIARLCEAELHSKGLPISAVTAGGDQNAPDGGLDVRVNLDSALQGGDFIPKSKTGFQVKVPDMHRSSILDEMQPHGKLRQVIKDLARESGAYIIVSAQGSTADSALTRRKDAMYEALSDDENKDRLTLDFFDRNRVASWVRSYPGLAAWVRERTGWPYNEWYPYSNWAEPDKGIDAEYFSDDKCRFVDEQCPRDGEIIIEEGIDRIRRKLAKPKESVRLVGLSGTGKTRLAQALFDSRIGKEPLDQAIVVYTDLGRSPDPTPTQLISHLIQQNKRAIVIIDNCPPETHASLATVCSVANSKVSLMTIEYDVGDDTPEKTEVFRLHTSSEGVIESILATHAPNVSQVDRRHIAELSDGNARIALALAHTVRRGESITNLSNQELFNRLFHQRRQRNESLLRAAEALALVYSFNGEALDGDDAELPMLASIANQSVDELYRNVTELVDRELVQKRSKWRALLPQALANRLAHQSMERIHPDRISRIFTSQVPKRLLKSFSHRLGYLHESEGAQKVVEVWLSDEGFLATHMHNFNELGMALFQNIAPVSPDKTLLAIERVMDGENRESFISLRSRHRSTWVELFRSLSYEPDLFERATKLLIEFSRLETSNNNTSSARNTFIGLFHLYLSGTHASHTQRVGIIKALIQSGEESDQQLGLEAMDAMLEAWHFSSHHTFTFGARPRDYGWEPKTFEDIKAWFAGVLEYATELAVSDSTYSDQVKSIIANKIRGIITKAGLIELVEDLTDNLLLHGAWLDGWKAVRETISFDSKDMPDEIVDRLHILEKKLRPQSLEERINAYVKSIRWGYLDIADGEPVDDPDDVSAAYDRVETIAKELGKEAVASPDFSILLSKLVCGEVGQLSWSFGRGIASGSRNISDTWECFVSALSNVPSEQRNVNVLRGFLRESYEIDAEQTDAFLDSVIDHPQLGSLFPDLQTSIKIDPLGAERLERAIELGLAPVTAFRSLTLGGVVASTPPEALASLLNKIASQEEGSDISIDILGMRFHADHSNGGSIAPELIECGRKLLANAVLQNLTPMSDHHLGEIAKECLVGSDATDAARELCQKIYSSITDHGGTVYNFQSVLKYLFKQQPEVALNEFVDGGRERNHRIDFYLINDRFPIQEAPVENVVSWAEIDPQQRYLRLASIVPLLVAGNGQEGSGWSDIARSIIEHAPEKAAVLEAFASNLRPSSWSGSLASILESRRILFQEFFQHDDPAVVSKARELDGRIHEWAEREAERERSESRNLDERFE